MTTHDILVDLNKKLNYPQNPGCCHGFSLRWLEAFLLTEEHIFSQRIKKIVRNRETFAQSIAIAQNKKGKNLTAEDRQLFDILAFFDSMNLYHAPTMLKSLFHTRYAVTQLKMSWVSKYAASDKISALGGLAEIDVEPIMYSKNEFKKYLKGLSLIFDQTKSAEFNRTGMILVGTNHTVTLGYIPKKGWTFTDINNYPPKFFSKREPHLLLKQIASSFKSDSFFSFNVHIYTTGNNPHIPALKDQLALFKKGRPITAEMAMRESQGVNLLWTAVKSEHTPTLIELAKYPTKYNIRRPVQLDTPVHMAAYSGNTNILKQLGAQSVNFNVEDMYSYSPAAEAAMFGHSDFIAEIGKPKYKVDLNAGNKKDNNTPAHIAAIYGNANVISELAKFHVDLNKPNNRGETPALIAVYNGDLEVIRELGSHGVNFNIPDSGGHCASHIAASSGKAAVIKELAKYGVNFNTISYGLTPSFLVAIHGHTDALVTLMNLGANWSCPSLVPINFLKNIMGLERASKLNDFLKTRIIDINGRVYVTPYDAAELMGHTATLNALNSTVLQHEISRLKMVFPFPKRGFYLATQLEKVVVGFINIGNDQTQIGKKDALRWEFQATLNQLHRELANLPGLQLMFNNITLASKALGLQIQDRPMQGNMGFFNRQEKQHQDNLQLVTAHRNQQVISPAVQCH